MSFNFGIVLLILNLLIGKRTPPHVSFLLEMYYTLLYASLVRNTHASLISSDTHTCKLQ
jgi:hypothetical protein